MQLLYIGALCLQNTYNIPLFCFFVKVLIHHGADVHETDFHGWTALVLAAIKGHLEVVEVSC